MKNKRIFIMKFKSSKYTIKMNQIYDDYVFKIWKLVVRKIISNY